MTASTLAGGIGGVSVTHAICIGPGGGCLRGVGLDGLGGGVTGLGCEFKLSGEKEGQLDGGLGVALSAASVTADVVALSAANVTADVVALSAASVTVDVVAGSVAQCQLA